jgi:hypothetical protein
MAKQNWMGALAGVAIAALTVSTAQAAPLFINADYGTFLGSWAGNVPQSNAGDTLEALIKAAYPADAPFNTLGDGINQLNLVGKVDPPPGTDTRLEVAVTATNDDGDGLGGTWKYLPDADPNTPPGNEAVDFYLLLKYDGVFSIFYYPSVEPNDTGKWTTNVATLNAIVEPDIGLCGAPPKNTTNAFLGLCYGANSKGNAQGISHIEAYWPPIGPTDIAEPVTLSLLGAGLLGLAAFRRRRA